MTYTLSCTSGGFTLTGQAAALAANVPAAAAGTLALRSVFRARGNELAGGRYRG